MRTLKFDKELGVLALETVEYLAVDHHDDVANLVTVLLDQAVELTLNFDRHRHRSLHATLTLTVGTRFIHRIQE